MHSQNESFTITQRCVTKVCFGLSELSNLKIKIESSCWSVWVAKQTCKLLTLSGTFAPPYPIE